MIALDILFADLENPEQDTALGAAIARADNVLLPVSFRINEKVPPLRAAFVDALHHFGIGVSWGGYESLVLPVTPQRSAGTWAEDGQLVRFNIGLEETASLKADLAAALPLLNPASE